MLADEDHDGFVSQRELADFSDFQHADLNHDGCVDPIEMRFSSSSVSSTYVSTISLLSNYTVLFCTMIFYMRNILYKEKRIK